MVTKVPDNATAEKSGTAEHGDDAIVNHRHDMNSQAAALLARRFSTAAQVVYSIDFTKDNVQRTDDCGNIGQHVAPAEEVQRSLALRTLSVDKRSDQPQQRIVFWPNGLFRKKITQPYRRSLAAGRFARLVHDVDMA